MNATNVTNKLLAFATRKALAASLVLALATGCAASASDERDDVRVTTSAKAHDITPASDEGDSPPADEPDGGSEDFPPPPPLAEPLPDEDLDASAPPPVPDIPPLPPFPDIDPDAGFEECVEIWFEWFGEWLSCPCNTTPVIESLDAGQGALTGQDYVPVIICQ